MLIRPSHRGTAMRGPSRQRGAVLIVALLLLVAMTMAGLAMMRSVSTSNVVAGNLAFQQAATHSADAGVEAAIAFLEANSTGTTLHASVLTGSGTRYVAQRQDPAAGQSWDDFWTGSLAGSGAVNSLATDAAGNTVSYVIHRLCNSTGAPAYPGCSAAPQASAAGCGAGGSCGAGQMPLNTARQVYYRITARVTGPRNTLSYVQATVAM